MVTLLRWSVRPVERVSRRASARAGEAMDTSSKDKEVYCSMKRMESTSDVYGLSVGVQLLSKMLCMQ